MTPPGQHRRAPRTRQPARSESLLDRDRVGLYREHRASARNHTALPHASGQGQQREGRGLPRPEDRHGDGADQAGQRDSPNPSVIRTLNGAGTALRRHPGRRSTLVVRPSGCGKSSLVRAGLLPVMAGERGWQTVPAILPGDPAGGGADPRAGRHRPSVRAGLVDGRHSPPS
jgi:hypothetical protein